MPILHAIVLGLVQGLTEFLPVSSSGHLQLVPWLFGWDDFAGDEDLEQAFDVALHLGTLVGAIAYFWRDLGRLLVGAYHLLVRRQPSTEGRTALLLVATMVPAGIVAVVGERVIDALDDQIWLTALTLIVFGLLLLVADRLGGTRLGETFGLRDAAVLGLAQACALQPGVSRSGVSITAARSLGFARPDATRLVFLMSLPIIGGAGVYQFAEVQANGGIPSELYAPFAWGVLTSAMTGWLAVWGTLRFIRNRTFAPFTVYRVLVGLTVLGILATSWR